MCLLAREAKIKLQMPAHPGGHCSARTNRRVSCACRRRMATCGNLLDVLDERRRWVAQAAEAAEAAKKEAEKNVEDAKKALKSDADVQARFLRAYAINHPVEGMYTLHAQGRCASLTLPSVLCCANLWMAHVPIIGRGASRISPANGSVLSMRWQEGMLLDEVPGPSTDLMDEDRIGASSGRPKRRR